MTILFLKAFKDQSGFALYGNPPRWHKISVERPAPGDAHAVALQYYHAKAVQQLKEKHHGTAGMTAQAMADEAHALGKQLQQAETTKGFLVKWLKAVNAGEVPTAGQQKAFAEQPLEKRQQILAKVAPEKISATPYIIAAVGQVQLDATPPAQPAAPEPATPESTEGPGTQAGEAGSEPATSAPLLTPAEAAPDPEDDRAAAKLAELLAGTGSYYGIQAAKKLAADAAWKALAPMQQLTQVVGLAKEMQAVATEKAYLPKAMKKLLEGKVPTITQMAAIKSLMNSGPSGAEKVKAAFQKVEAQVGASATDLMNQGWDALAASTAEKTEEAVATVPAAAVEEGPKEGDTKPGADGGTLVFKDGRWHKQEEASPDLSATAKEVIDGYAASGSIASLQSIAKGGKGIAPAWQAYAAKKLAELKQFDPWGDFANLKNDIDAAEMAGDSVTLAEIQSYLESMHDVPGQQFALGYVAQKIENARKSAPPESGGESPAQTEPAGPQPTSDWTVETHTHTQTGESLPLVKIPKPLGKLDNEQYKTVAAAAKKHGGYWSKFGKGFLFKQNGKPYPEGAQQFAAEMGQKTPTAAPSLAGEPAYDHLVHEHQKVAGHPAGTTFPHMKGAAEDWLAANPGAWDEVNEALTEIGYGGLAKFGPENPVPAPAAAKAPRVVKVSAGASAEMPSIPGGLTSNNKALKDVMFSLQEAAKVVASDGDVGASYLSTYINSMSAHEASGAITPQGQVVLDYARALRDWAVAKYAEIAEPPKEVVTPKANVFGFLSHPESGLPVSYADKPQAAHVVDELKKKGVLAYVTGDGPYAIKIDGDSLGKVGKTVDAIKLTPPVRPEPDEDFSESQKYSFTGFLTALDTMFNDKDWAALNTWLTEKQAASAGWNTESIGGKKSFEVLQYAKDLWAYGHGGEVWGGVAPSGPTNQDTGAPAPEGHTITVGSTKYTKLGAGEKWYNGDTGNEHLGGLWKATALEILSGHTPMTLPASDDKREIAAEWIAEVAPDKVPEALAKLWPDGPQDGNTKVINGKTYVLKNGRWHLVGDEPKAVPSPDSTEPPDLEGMPSFKELGAYTQAGFHKIVESIQAAVAANGKAGLKGCLVISPANKKIWIKAPGGYPKLKINLPPKTDHAKAMLTWVQAMQKSVGIKPKAIEGFTPGYTTPPAAPKVTTATQSTGAPPAPAGVESVAAWTKVGEQQGYNPGGTYRDPAGQEWYVKFQASSDIARNELLANRLYAAAGLAVPELKLVAGSGGKLGTASKIVAGLKEDKALLASGQAHAIFDGFAADAWLANWDAVGNNPAAGKGFDNIQFTPDGKAWRIDAGGTMQYGGAGTAKSDKFGDTVDLKSFLDPAVNANTAKAFGGMSPADLKASVAKVLGISDATIKRLVADLGGGSGSDKMALAKRLIARRDSLAAQFPDVAKKVGAERPAGDDWAKLKPGEKIVEHGKQFGTEYVKIEIPPKGFNAEGIPKPYAYDKSSKAWVNAQNTADLQKIYDTAISGDGAEAVENLRFEAVDKETGQKSGVTYGIDQHPSKLWVKEYFNQVLAELKAQLEPTYRIEHHGSLVNGYNQAAAEIASFVKTINYAQFATWKTKAADYIVLDKKAGEAVPQPAAGQFHNLEPTDAKLKEFKAASDANYHKLSAAEQQACKSYTGSAYSGWNSAMRMGDTTSSAFKASLPMQKAFEKAAVDLPDGIILHRGIGVGGDTYKSVVGAVIQDGSFQSCSFGNHAAFSNHTSQLRIHVTKGVKAVMATTFSSHNEREIILHPNTRYIVTKVETVGGKHIVDVIALPHEVA